MQDKLLKILKSICGEPVYKAVFIENDGSQVVRPVYRLPERMVIRR